MYRSIGCPGPQDGAVVDLSKANGLVRQVREVVLVVVRSAEVEDPEDDEQDDREHDRELRDGLPPGREEPHTETARRPRRTAQPRAGQELIATSDGRHSLRVSAGSRTNMIRPALMSVSRIEGHGNTANWTRRGQAIVPDSTSANSRDFLGGGTGAGARRRTIGSASSARIAISIRFRANTSHARCPL